MLIFLAMNSRKRAKNGPRSKKGDIVAGTIRVHPRGFGFVIPSDKVQFPEDIFIPRHSTLGAVDGDSVEASSVPSQISDKGPEGKVLKILRRGRSHLAGIISYVGKKKQLLAYAPLLGEDKAIVIRPTRERELAIGDRIIIHVLDWGGKQRDAIGEMSAYIGHISDPSCDVPAAIEEFDLSSDFPEEVLAEAKAYGEKVTEKDWKGRKDLTDLTCFTIDPDTAKDYDDALSLSRDPSGNYHLGIHIADVSHYVKPGSALDCEAMARCNSVYFPGTVLPMLPHALSSHLCSLKPNVERLAISVSAILDQEGELLEYRIDRTVIKSRKRFTYGEAREVLDGKKKSHYRSHLELMVELCRLLKIKRYERGSIEFSLPDLTLDLTPEGHVKGVGLVEYDITHQLVEEFMLLANEIVATHLSEAGKELTYRVHEEPNPENLRDFALTAQALGFTLPPAPTTEELQLLFDAARESPFGQFLATSFIKSMKLASYSTQNIGHYGLGLEHYTHFTSPIRRYIDLIVHRALFHAIKEDEDLEEIAARCSDKERLSAKAESSVTQLKKLRYLNALLQEGQELFAAVVVAVKPFGVIFELTSLLFEGFVPLPNSRLPVGTPVKVRLNRVDLVTRQTEWSLKR